MSKTATGFPSQARTLKDHHGLHTRKTKLADDEEEKIGGVEKNKIQPSPCKPLNASK